MAKSRKMLAQDLVVGDKIIIPSPRVRIIEIIPLSDEYNTKIRGRKVKVESIDHLWKGQITLTVLGDDDKVETEARPGFIKRLLASFKSKPKKAKKEAKKPYEALPFFMAQAQKQN